MKRILWTISSTMAALGLGAAAVLALNLRGEEPLTTSASLQSTPELVARGEYLARVGNCMACHTVQGGAPYAGGRGIDTPFGVIHSPNLTPDKATGLGNWSAAEFWRALPRCTSSIVRSAMATRARAGRGRFRPWPATAP